MTEDFIVRIRSEFQGYAEVQQQLERGGIALGHALQAAVRRAEEELPANIIAITGGPQRPQHQMRDRCHRAALAVKRKQDIFKEWQRLLEEADNK